MFSEIDMYPSHSLRLRSTGELPQHVDREFHGAVVGGTFNEVVSGQNRYKFFRRPIVPFLHSVPPEVLLAPTNDEEVNPLVPVMEVEETGATRSVGVQTKFRESQTQTDPYTPDYTVRPGAEPEILTLATLSHGVGLPAGLAEIEMIERAREKREFENQLPAITDEASFELRRKMMEEQELREWAQREAEIDSLQAERLDLLQTAIRERDQENDFLAEQRMEALRQSKLEEKDAAIMNIQRHRIKMLRKLSKSRKTVLPPDQPPGARTKRRDIIQEYANFGSTVYAPVTRLGRHPDRGADSFEVQPADLASLPGLTGLEASLPRSLTTTLVHKPAKGVTSGGGGGAGGGTALRSAAARKEAAITGHLARMDAVIKTAKLTASGQLPATAQSSQTVLLPSWRRKTEKTVRPATPRVPDVDPAADELANAVITIQKLLRGRAVQNTMFEGKEKRRELIRELYESERSLAAQTQRVDEEEEEREQRRVRVLEGAMDTVQGEVVSYLLDYLSKELVRMQQRGRISALVNMAEATRRQREAEESGRRQAEQQLRAREAVMFQQVLRVHQGTADTFLDEAFQDAIEDESKKQAVVEVKVQRGALAPIVDKLEAARNDPDVVVRDLVASFLLPEVERHRVQHRIQLEERRFVDAAHKSIYQVVKDVEAQLSLAPSTPTAGGGLLEE